MSSQLERQFLIVGLGNPGREYAHTRHNVGFDVLDLFAKAHSLSFGRTASGAQVAEGRVSSARVALLKPMTYMNLSGEPLRHYLRHRPHAPEEILVVVDDIHLPLATIRIRPAGSEGGHNGLKSISAQLQTKEYPRLRIGVGEPGDTRHQVDHVLSRFSTSERKAVAETIDRAVAALETWITDGLEIAMNRFNGAG